MVNYWTWNCQPTYNIKESIMLPVVSVIRLPMHSTQVINGKLIILITHSWALILLLSKT